MSEKKRRYIDSCVLMHALQGSNELLQQRAIEVLKEPDVEFLYSAFVQFETLPLTVHNREKYPGQTEWFQEFFEGATCIPWQEGLAVEALRLMCDHRMTLVDAVHVAISSAHADEMVTSEGPEKPMVKRPGSKVWTIADA